MLFPSNQYKEILFYDHDQSSMNYLTQVSANSAIYLDTDVTVQSISLPANGQLILRPSVTIRLSSESDCTGMWP